MSESESSFNDAMEQIRQNNQCYDSITTTIFSNPQYYTVDSRNNLLLTTEGNKIFSQLIQQNADCVNVRNQPPPANADELISEYKKMVKRRQEIDQNMNQVLNMNSATNYTPTLFKQSNQSVSAGIMFTVLAITMLYYVIRHTKD